MQTTTYKDPVFYTPAMGTLVPQVIDVANYAANGELVGLFSRESIDLLRKRYPAVKVGEMEEVLKVKERMLCTEPQRIDAATYLEALTVLPPEGFKANADGESFKCSEHTSGRITAIYALHGTEYFTFNDVYTLPHQEIMRRIARHKVNAGIAGIQKGQA